MNDKLLKVQKEIKAIKKDSVNPHFKNSYYDINTLLETVKPILNKNGLIVLQPLTHIDGKLALETIIMESEGTGRFSSITPLPETVKPQEAGSAISYFRRYALASMLALEGEDDDANLSSGHKVVKTAKGSYRYPTATDEGIDTTRPPFTDGPINNIADPMGL